MLQNFRKLFSVLHSARWLLLGSQLLSFLTILFNILLLATSAWLISTAALHPELAVLSLAIVGVRFYGISRACARYAERYISHNMAFQGLYALRTWLYRVIEPLAPAVLRSYGAGDILGRIMADIETLQFFYLRVLIPPLTALFITIGFGWYLGTFSLWLTFLLVVAFLVTGILGPYLTLRWRNQASSGLVQQRRQLKEDIVETLNGMMDIVAYNSRDTVRERLLAQWEEEDGWRASLGSGANRGTTFFMFFVQVFMLLGLLLMVHIVELDGWSGVYIAVVAIGIQAYFEAIQPMNDVFYYYQESAHTMKRLMALTEHPVPVAEPIPKETETIDVSSLQGAPSLQFDNVSFSYGGQVLFTDFSLAVKSGEHVAIVGPSGAGKTTLFSILERFYPYTGSITINGKELSRLTQENSRAVMSVVNQEPYIFHASLEDNIRLAKPHASEEEMIGALTKSALQELATTIGMDTLVGGGGSQLSGGERQRVALARLFLQDHWVWLLDEPLEGLDQRTRNMLQQQLMKSMQGKTVLYITHQLQGLQAMDRIVFLEQGRIKEMGSYEELMALEGAFYQYVRLSMASI